MSDFWESDTYQIVKAMKRHGNRPGLISEWKDAVEHWAMLPENAKLPDAEAVRAWLPNWQPRPFYTAAELAPLWPALAIAIGYSARMLPVRSARRLEHELDFAGLPRVKITISGPICGTAPVARDCPDPSQFFIVERIHHWNRPINFEEFFNALG